MTRIEHRLTDALAARAKAVDPNSVRPLPWAAPVPHRRERRRRWLAPAAAAISIVVIAAVAGLVSRHTPRAGHRQDHPITAQRATFHGELLGVDALSATNAWAVGEMFQKGSGSSHFQPLIMHWDGRSWRRVPVPSKADSSSLLAVSGSSPDDVWAVGSWTQALHHTGEALILHWNGKNWRLARSAGSFKASQLDAVSARSSTDAWAVGDAGNNGALLLHWNGRIWRQAPAPAPLPGRDQYLGGVADISSSDAWGVGGDGSRELILHWNGTSWRIAPSTGAERDHSNLMDMSALSASEIWAIGYGLGPGNIKFVHWNGSVWHAEPGPNIPVAPPVFWGIAAISPDDIWGAGSTNNIGLHGDVLIMRWNGNSWSVPKGFNRHVHGAIFHLSVRSASDIWAVGRQGRNPLILHWNGKSWTKALS